jgi:KDO2-lipid IV(A) lauroyltransferase
MFGPPLVLAYRPANNPLVDRLIHYVRGHYYAEMHAKGSMAARALVKAIRRGAPVGILIDQKLNDGMKIDFAGLPAMTTPLPAELAIRYPDVAIIPSRITRLNGAHFIMELFPAPAFARTGNDREDAISAMTCINALFSEWLLENPAQWFLVHKRWSKEAYKDI